MIRFIAILVIACSCEPQEFACVNNIVYKKISPSVWSIHKIGCLSNKEVYRDRN